MPPGEIEVTDIYEISMTDITSDLAHRSGFDSVGELLRIAVHGPGRRVFVVEFHYISPTDCIDSEAETFSDLEKLHPEVS